MKKEEFYFDSRDNRTKLHAVRWTPDSGNVVAVVQIVHGMAEHVERYEKLAQFLTDRNIVVTGEDHLGHGKSVSRGGVKGYFCEQDPATVVVRDVHRLKKMTQELYPGVPYFILGHSMGSFIVRNYMGKYGTGIRGVILCGTGMQSGAALAFTKLLTGWEKLIKGSRKESCCIHKAAFGAYNKRIENPKTPYDWLTTDEAVVGKYMADENCGFIFTVNGFQTLFELMARAQSKDILENTPDSLPVFLASGENDPVGDYGKNVKKVKDMLEEAGLQDVTLKLYSGARHEIFNEANGEQAMEDVAGWLSRYLAIPSGV